VLVVGEFASPCLQTQANHLTSSSVRGFACFHSDLNEITALAMDTLAVTLGAKISALVPGFVSTEVDPRLSFDMEASVAKGRRIISLYEERVRAGEK
jgi:transaldolase